MHRGFCTKVLHFIPVLYNYGCACTHMCMWVLLFIRLKVLSIRRALVFITRTKFSVSFKIQPFIDSPRMYTSTGHFWSSRWPVGLLSLIFSTSKGFRVGRFTK